MQRSGVRGIHAAGAPREKALRLGQTCYLRETAGHLRVWAQGVLKEKSVSELEPGNQITWNLVSRGEDFGFTLIVRESQWRVTS